MSKSEDSSSPRRADRPVAKGDPEPGDASREPRSAITWWEKAFLYVLLSTILLGLGYTLNQALFEAKENYGAGLGIAERYINQYLPADGSEGAKDGAVDVESRTFRPDITLLYTLQLSRANTADTIKIAALFLGFFTVAVGCLFVLYGAEAYYRLRVSQREVRSSLETSSPGLVLITLGVVIIGMALMTKSTFSTEVNWPVPLGATASGRAAGDIGTLELQMEALRRQEEAAQRRIEQHDLP